MDAEPEMDRQIYTDGKKTSHHKALSAIFDVKGATTKISNIFDACQRGSYRSVMTYAKAKDFDVDAKDRYGRTPLIWAADCGHAKICESLIRLNANIHVTDDFTGRTALHWASRTGSLPIVRLLVAYGADVNKEDNFSLTPLFLAKSQGIEGEKVFEYLKSEGAIYNEQKKICPCVTAIEEQIMSKMASLNISDEEQTTNTSPLRE